MDEKEILGNYQQEYHIRRIIMHQAIRSGLPEIKWEWDCLVPTALTLSRIGELLPEPLRLYLNNEECKTRLTKIVDTTARIYLTIQFRINEYLPLRMDSIGPSHHYVQGLFAVLPRTYQTQIIVCNEDRFNVEVTFYMEKAV